MKASEIFIKYAEPLMNEVANELSADSLQKALRIPEMVWNALVMEEWGENKPDYIKMMYDQFNDTGPAFKKRSKEMIKMWIRRKKDLFPDAKWTFEITVRPGKDGPIIRAYTRIPGHLRHTVPKEWQIGNVRPLDFQV